MISEKEREALFWKISLLFVLASPLIVFQLARAHYSFDFNPIVLTIFLLLIIPFNLLVDAVLIKLFGAKSRLRFWVVKPTDEVRHLLSASVEKGEVPFKELLERTYLKQIVEAVSTRLSEFGFESTIEENAADSCVITFHKAKNKPVISFMDHSIFGEVQVRLSGSAVEVRVRTTFDDTLILETGEFERLRAFCNYLSLKSPAFSYRNVPLAVYCGLNLAFLTSIAAIAPYRVGNLVITCLSLAAVGMSLAALVLMLRKRDQVFGYRLVFAGLYLGALPLVAYFVQLLK